jgi:hypothetical protein
VDLFGRKARKLNKRALILLKQKDRERAELRLQLFQYAQEIGAYKQSLEEAAELIVSLNSEIQRLEAEHYTNPLPSVAHTSDEEAELRWQLDNKLIDKEQFRRLMEQLQFENTEVELAPEYGVRADFSY